ncbi:GntR family transcriptional regulator [Streptomyces asoensis]|uniref:GntR family transcriptional regulator n=1 Tax=Streptomyces asoensis TaxID=249586 RepID=A0ABQ3S7X5_9ACTN|nr:GntR family transcriptional regulator [Streptomyces asoensis]GGQ76254.1 GntR family transcriptional regulator [Streptomyces asoensis]GHI64052.1 GntR family transcriptional regulator [Streptomyces asoensis]
MAKTGDRSRAVPGSPLDALPFALDRTSPVPLYYQLAQQLESAIEHGALAPGNLLGNEIDLSARLGLSRPTVRQAIQSLVDKGLLVRRRGVGTQVVHSQVKRPLELSSLYDDLETAGQGPTTHVLRNERVPAAADVAAALGVAEGSEVIVLERLRATHGQPVAFLCNYLPPDLLDLGTQRLESTGLYRLLRAAGITLHSARQTIGARSATAEEAALLAEKAGAALLTMQRTAYDDTGRPAEYGTHVYRASRYAFDFQLLVRV